MTPLLPVAPGTRGTYGTVVDDTLTAHAFGNAGVHVLATCMVGLFAERALSQGVSHLVPEGFSIVGVRQQVHHRAPAVAGTRVVAAAIVERIEGFRVHYRFRVETEAGLLLAEGDGESALVNADRFLRRAEDH